MPKLKFKLPKYSRHKATDQAVVRLDGKDHYLGRYGTPESQARYRDLLKQCLAPASSPVAAVAPDGDTRVCELFDAYLEFAKQYYVKNDRPTGEVANLKDAMRPVSEMFAMLRISEFGPRQLKQSRDRMIAEKLSRKVVNARVNRLRRIFKWGVENELVEPSVLQSLQAVAPLKAGRSEAMERGAVRPVAEEHIEAVLQRVSPRIAAMIKLQLLTGMRPGEVVMMRVQDLQMDGAVWTYRPSTHKTEHHGIERAIFLGPKAQEVLREFIKRKVATFLFRPIDAIRDLHANRRKQAKAPRRKPWLRRRKPRRFPKDHYTSQSYCYAVHKACKKAGIPTWGPNRLRHNAATVLRKDFGIEVARVILGHTSAAMTEIYAELDRTKAADIMAQVG